jgi:hypothetical protein
MKAFLGESTQLENEAQGGRSLREGFQTPRKSDKPKWSEILAIQRVSQLMAVEGHATCVSAGLFIPSCSAH